MIRAETLPDGRVANTFYLKNTNGITVDVSEFGATILNIFTPDRNGHFDNIVPGYDSLSFYINDPYYFGGVVGRFANRIANGKFTVDSVTYSLPKNEKGINHLHGGVEGLNKKLWKGEAFVNDKGQGVKLTYTSKDGEEGYPGNLIIHATYTLTHSNELHIDFLATTDKATIVNLTNHSYFNLSGNFDNNILVHVLQINANSYLPVNRNLVPSGDPVKVDVSPFDFRTPRLVGRDISNPDLQLQYCNGGYDHNFVLNKPRNEVSLAVHLSEAISGRVLELYTDQPGLQFYSGNFFNGSVTGKGGCAYKKYSTLVFEPQKFPDSPNHPSYPSVILRPGEKYTHHTVLKFAVAE